MATAAELKRRLDTLEAEGGEDTVLFARSEEEAERIAERLKHSPASRRRRILIVPDLSPNGQQA